jgi:hypothetical protein
MYLDREQRHYDIQCSVAEKCEGHLANKFCKHQLPYRLIPMLPGTSGCCHNRSLMARNAKHKSTEVLLACCEPWFWVGFLLGSFDSLKSLFATRKRLHQQSVLFVG